jgi:hypothetical protein
MPKKSGIILRPSKTPKKKGKKKVKAFIGPLPRPKFIGPLPRPKRAVVVSERHFTAPKAYGYQRESRPPRVNGGRVFEITHSEYLQPVVTDNKFSITTYNLQFASIDNFPWAGPVCQNWDQFQIIKCTYRFEPRCGTDQKGRLIVATQKNVEEASFTADYEMLAYNGAKDGSLWKRMRHNCAIRLNAPLKKYYTLVDGATAVGDPTAYTPGKMSFSCYSNDTVGTVVMDLFVDYTVRLFNTKQQPAITAVQGLQVESKSATNQHPELGMDDPDYRFSSFTESVLPVIRAGAYLGELVTEFKQVGAYFCGVYGDAQYSIPSGQTSNIMQILALSDVTCYSKAANTTFTGSQETWTVMDNICFVAAAAATMTYVYTYTSPLKPAHTEMGVWPIPLLSATFLSKSSSKRGCWIVSHKDEKKKWFQDFVKKYQVRGYKVLFPGLKYELRGELAIESKEEKVEELQPGLDHESDHDNEINIDDMIRTSSVEQRRQWADAFSRYDQSEADRLRSAQVDPDKQKKLDSKIQEQEKRNKSPAK